MSSLQPPLESPRLRASGHMHKNASFNNLDEAILQENVDLRRLVSETEARIDALQHNLAESRVTDDNVDEELETVDRDEDPNEAAARDAKRTLTIVVLGASGDLAKKKTFPALYGLFRDGLLPPQLAIVGYARSKMSAEEFAEQVSQAAKPKPKEEHFEKTLADFKARCSYVQCGAYDSVDDMAKLAEHIKAHIESSIDGGNRLFYLALPPSVFVAVGTAIKKAGFGKRGWNRVIVEKPFGKDYQSCKELTSKLGELFAERQQYRIDHYLGKEMSQNLMVLRFANAFFEPLWNRHYISNVKITFKETIGTEGRGGYFDGFGIIRDVMQNHLMQLFALMAMEPPVSMNSEDVRDEKVKVLRATEPVGLEDIIVGQYTRSEDGSKPAYTDDKGVPKDSITPTFAQSIMWINNPRWSGVPFIVKCGKALDSRKAEIRIQFRKFPHTLFPTAQPNELVIRVQPNEAIYMNVTNKVPGLSNDLTNSDLDLSYNHKFNVEHMPEAYERLILDAVRGDQNLFVRVDELNAAWRIFTPVLHALEAERIEPILYPFGTRGPPEADQQALRVGWVDTHDKKVSAGSLPTKANL